MFRRALSAACSTEFSVSPESVATRLTRFASRFTLFELPAMFTAEGVSHSPAATRQRNDRKADFRCGANPQRGESSWASRQKICKLSPASLRLATSAIATNFSERLHHLTVPRLRAVVDTRLTATRMENDVETAMRKEIDELRGMTVGQLREKHLGVFGEESRSNHKQFLFRRIAWRIQALAEGGLSERARRRALEIANDADLRIQPSSPQE